MASGRSVGCALVLSATALGSCGDDATGGAGTETGGATQSPTGMTTAMADSGSSGPAATTSTSSDPMTSTDGSTSESSGGSTDRTTGSSTTGSTSTTTGGAELCDAMLDPDAPITFVPDRVVVDDNDILYLFDEPADRIVLWSAQCGSAHPVIQLAPGAYEIAYASQHDAIYVGYEDGTITAIDLGDPTVEDPFATLLGTPLGLAVAGDYVFAVDTEGAWESHYTFAADGTPADAIEWTHPSPEYVWNDASERIYFFRQGTSPNDLHWEQIDQATGLFVDEGESPHHGDYAILPPIRISDDGALILLGTGHVYDGITLERPDAVPAAVQDAIWAGGSFVTLEGDGPTRLERWDAGDFFARIDAALFPGSPVAFAQTADTLYVLSFDSGALQFGVYSPGDDGDGDGVAYSADAFPADPAASDDTDHDGAPDAWNAGADETDSVTGLVLDAHPNLAACTVEAVCDLQAQTLSAAPTSAFVDTTGVIHLLSPADDRIIRWSAELSAFLDPIPVARDAELMTYDAGGETVFVSHADQWVGQLDLAGDLDQAHWRTLPEPAHGLAIAGNFVLAADPTGAWNTHYTFETAGAEVSREEWNRFSTHYAWNDVEQRIYFFRNGTSPNDVHWEEIDQLSGMIVADGESPYHGTYTIQGPIIVSPDGTLVMIGTGQIYDAVSLDHVDFLPGGDVVDVIWADDHILTARADPGGTIGERWTLTYQPELDQTFAGSPYRLFATPFGEVVVTLVANQPQFTGF